MADAFPQVREEGAAQVRGRMGTRRGAGDHPGCARLLAAAVLLGALTAAALDVDQIQWGFDGRVVPRRLNPLTVEVRNTTPEPFDGQVVLEHLDGLGRRTGARLVRDCFVSPFAAKLLQFAAYVSVEQEEWRLVLQPGDLRVPVPKTRFGPPARILLRAPGDFGPAAPGVRAFPETWFPPGVTWLDGLGEAVMDHVPRWDGARRQALADWLRAGGTVHLLPDPNGHWPEFSGELAVLNSPLERSYVGAGLVLRHQVERQELTDEYFTGKGFPPRELKHNDKVYGRLETALFNRLRALTTPHHNWGLIYGLIVLYMVAIGPLNYLVGRRGRWPLALLFLAGCVLGFSLVFRQVGRRGYGEEARADAVGYAEALGDGNYDVTQWLNVFVTRGGQYQFGFAGRHQLFSTCQDMAAVSGVVRHGRDACFVADVPLFSARPFLHRARLSGPVFSPAVASWAAAGDRLQTLAVGLDGQPPATLRAVWAWYDDMAYRLARGDDGIWRLGDEPGTDAEALFTRELAWLRHGAFYPGAYRRRGADIDFDSLADDAMWALVARSRGDVSQLMDGSGPAPASFGRLDLYLLADSPESFAMNTPGPWPGARATVYHFGLRPPSESTDAEP